MTESSASLTELVSEPPDSPLDWPPAAQSPGFVARFTAALQQVTIADALVALAVLVAALVRFRNLGSPVLSPAEATAALGSWQFSQAGETVVAVTSPAYFTLTNAAMLLLGDSDLVARLVPAVFGTLSVALVWFLRPVLRPAGMVAAAAFLALSPLNVLVARTAGGASLAIFALLLTVVSAVRLGRSGRSEWAYALGAALGLGFTSAPLFVSGIVALAPLWAWLARRTSDTNDDTREVAPVAAHWRAVLIGLVVSFVLLGTSFFLYTPGLGDAFGISAAWLGTFGLPSPATPGGLFAPFLMTLRYEPAAILLGVPALMWAITRRVPFGWLLAGWLVVLAVLALVQPQLAGSSLLMTIPAYLLVGVLAGSLFTPLADDRRIVAGVTGGLLLLGMILLVSMARYTRLALWSADQAAFLILALLAFVAAGGVLVLAMSYNSTAARQGAFLGLVILLLYAQWGTTTALTQFGSNDPRELAVAEGTDDDMRVISQLLRDISSQLNGGETDLEVFSTVDTPAMRWYLRPFERAVFGATLPVQADSQVIIAPAGAELRLGEDYLGADFGVRQVRTLLDQPFSLNDTLKWLLFRESSTPVEIERAVLWVRSDLTGTGR